MKQLLIVLGMSPSGCIVTPKVESGYDTFCRADYQSLTLTTKQMDAFGSTCDDNCMAAKIANLVSVPASVIVSGSVVVAGDTVLWMEHVGSCFEALQRGRP